MKFSYILRPANQDDFIFLKKLHRSTLKKYVEVLWGWNDKQQDLIFCERFDPSKIQIIEYQKKNIGMLSVEDQGDKIFLANILISSKYQNLGIGTIIVKKLIETARKKKVPLSLAVLRPNPAKRFYESLGFEVVKEDNIRFFMELSF